MVQFPETAMADWRAAEAKVNVAQKVRKRIIREAQVEREVEKAWLRREATLRFEAELAAEDSQPLRMGTMQWFEDNQQANLPDLIEGVVKDQALTIVLGPSGVGKTTISLQIAHSLLTGQHFLGQPSQMVGHVGILSFDQNSNLMQSWTRKTGVDMSTVSMVDLFGRFSPLNIPSERSKMAVFLKSVSAEVLLVDSFSASFHGADQNDTAAVMNYYRELKKFAFDEVGVRAVIIIVHSTPEKPKKPRGSTAHVDVSDSIVAVTLEDAADKNSPRRVEMMKYRADDQTEMAPVIISAPDSVTHLVGVDPNQMAMAGLAMPGSAKTAREMFDLNDEPQEQEEIEDEEA